MESATGKRAIVEALEKLAFALELTDGGSPKSRTFASAARTIRQLQGDAVALFRSGELGQVRGIGPAVLKVVGAVLEEREVPELAELEAAIPPGLFELREIRGLGPARIRALWKELGVTSIGELEHACSENRLISVPGFGTKLRGSIEEALAERRQTVHLLRRDEAKKLLDGAIDALRKAGLRTAIGGPFSRGYELVDALPVIVEETLVPADALDAIRARHPRIAFQTAPAASFGTAVVHKTSDEAHWNALVARAGHLGFSLSEKGLLRGENAIPTASDEALYAALGLHPTPAERRDADVPLVEIGKARPRLVERRDLRGALHNHTVASDGVATLGEMRAAAAAWGLEYLGIQEHSVSAHYARGLSSDALSEQLRIIRALNTETPRGCALVTGVETDIREDGSLDYEDDVLAGLELIVASVHRRHGQDEAAMTARLCRAVQNPYADVLGHPTGRLLLSRPPSAFVLEKVLDACVASGCAVELNASPHRLDFSEAQLAAAKERGILVSIAADAHATDEIANLEHGISVARRAGLTPQDVLNTRTREELLAWKRARLARTTAV